MAREAGGMWLVVLLCILVVVALLWVVRHLGHSDEDGRNVPPGAPGPW